jgi:hypothetical protein
MHRLLLDDAPRKCVKVICQTFLIGFHLQIASKEIRPVEKFTLFFVGILYKEEKLLAQHINDLANQNPPLAFGRFQCYSSNPASTGYYMFLCHK